MRTLKFRYWNTITKEMVNNPKMPYKENWTIEQLFEDRGWVWMQFTGLTDRHGVEIYEGDIVRQYFELTRGSYDDVYIVSGNTLGAVKVLASKGAVIAKGRITNFEEDSDEHFELGDNFKPNSNLSLAGSRCEVIGNIYENPELLNTN